MLSLPVTQTNYGSKKVILRYEQKLGLYPSIHRQTGRYIGSNGEKNNDPALNPINIAFLESIAKETTLNLFIAD